MITKLVENRVSPLCFDIVQFLDNSLDLEIVVDGTTQLYPIPVDILDYQDLDQSSEEVNRGKLYECLKKNGCDFINISVSLNNPVHMNS